MKTRSTQKKRHRQPSRTAPALAKTAASRCSFSSSDGRRCRMLRAANHATLCFSHAKQEQELAQPGQDLSQELVSLSGNLNTATDVNHVLRKLFSLAAQRRVSRHDAVALAYIAQLILQTLQGVRTERQIVLGYDAWQETLRVAVGADEDEEAEIEIDQADQDDDEDDGDDGDDEEDDQDDQDDQERTGDPSQLIDDTAALKSLGDNAVSVGPCSATLQGGISRVNRMPNRDPTKGDQGSHPVPQNLAELARMVLARHARSRAPSQPVRGAT